MIVNRYREGLFSVVLTYYITVKLFLNLLGLRKYKILSFFVSAALSRARLVVKKQIITELNTAVADIDPRSLNKPCYLVLRFAAK